MRGGFRANRCMSPVIPTALRYGLAQVLVSAIRAFRSRPVAPWPQAPQGAQLGAEEKLEFQSASVTFFARLFSSAAAWSSALAFALFQRLPCSFLFQRLP